jgi:mannose-6-phosphate isomerase-like protein (cupin superfamily)
VRYCIQPGGTDGPVTLLARCPQFEQRLLRFDGAGEERRDDARDEVLYVLEGSGEAAIGGEATRLEPGTGAFVARGTPWRVESADGLLLLSVLVEDPLDATASHAVVPAGERDVATAGREFSLLAQPENGCASVTQFVVYILEGKGGFHVDGVTELLEPGTAVHLPARLVHCLENYGPGEMRVLGVFQPAGSPAEAYYPDGTPAVVPAA